MMSFALVVLLAHVGVIIFAGTKFREFTLKLVPANNSRLKDIPCALQNAMKYQLLLCT